MGFTSIIKTNKSSVFLGGLGVTHLRLPTVSITALALCFTVSAVYDAHAYIDPGTGSYLLQLMAAGLFGLAFTIKIFWRKIKTFVLKMFRKM